MTFQDLSARIAQFVAQDSENAVQASYAIDPSLIGMPYYDAPLIGCAAADDPLFARFREDPKIYGDVFRPAEEWLPGAKSIISFFLPYTKEVRDSNRPDLHTISNGWLHARVEGHAFLDKVTLQIAAWLEAEGHHAVIPAVSPEFRMVRSPERQALGEPVYVSNWSERHIAFTAGLGTFGLSKHLITEKGICGRFGSVITDAVFAPTPRAYTEPYEYCTFCGACTARCPIQAISTERGKDLLACADFVDGTRVTYAPRYGCGKCQLSVPCETGIPRK